MFTTTEDTRSLRFHQKFSFCPLFDSCLFTPGSTAASVLPDFQWNETLVKIQPEQAHYLVSFLDRKRARILRVD